jgi:hypothetical protein
MRVVVALMLVLAGFVILAGAASAHPGHDHDHAATADGGGHAHHGADHDSSDHSHPLGEDPFHEKSSHSTLDVAHERRLSEMKFVAPARDASPPFAERVGGIDLVPPVPPPLG